MKLHFNLFFSGINRVFFSDNLKCVCVWNWRRSTCRRFRKIVQFGRVWDEMRTPLEIFCSIGRRWKKTWKREKLLRNHESATLITICAVVDDIRCLTREWRWASETSRPFSLRHERVNPPQRRRKKEATTAKRKRNADVKEIVKRKRSLPSSSVRIPEAAPSWLFAPNKKQLQPSFATASHFL